MLPHNVISVFGRQLAELQGGRPYLCSPLGPFVRKRAGYLRSSLHA